MRTVVIQDGSSLQIDLVPENERDKGVLALIKAGDTFEAGKASGYAKCRGGYLRRFEDNDSVKFTYLCLKDMA